MRKKTIHLLGIIEFLILISTLLFFVLASETSMVYLVDKVTSSYDIKYKKLEGNLLKNITLKDVTYKDKLLTKEVYIDINFKALLKAEIKIDDISLKEVDLSVLEELIDDQNKKKKSHKKKLKDIPTLNIVSLYFSTKPYSKHDLNIDKLKFIANDIVGDFTKLSIGSFSLYTQSDYTNITADGKMNDGILDFNHLWITDIDLVKVQKFYKIKIKKHDLNSTTQTDNKKGFKNLIKEIKIDNFKTDINPYKHSKYKIKKLKLEARNFKTDFKLFWARETTISSTTNMWEIFAKGYIKENRLITDATVKLNDKYFKRFVPFFDFNKIKPIKLSLEVDQNGLQSDINLQTSNLLTDNLKELNASIKNVVAHADFNFTSLHLDVQLEGNLTSKYSKRVALNANLLYDKKFSYKGELFIDNLRNLDNSIIKLTKDSKIKFRGDTHTVQSILKNRNFVAEYSSKNYKKGLLEIKSNEIDINEYIKSLPPQLKRLKASLETKIPIDFHNLDNFDTDISLKSNAVNLKGKLSYLDGFLLNGDIHLVKNSLLQNFDKNLKINAFFPIHTKTSYKTSLLESKLTHKYFTSTIKYEPKNNMLDVNLKTDNDKLSLKGSTDKLFLNTSTTSLKTLQEHISKFYNFEKQPIDGEVALKGIIRKLDNMYLEFKSKWLVYEYSQNKFIFAENIRFNIKKDRNLYELQNYYFSTYLDYDRVFFSNKTSHISYKNSQITVDNLWINDQATIKGSYDINKTKGEFDLKADNYHYKGVEGDLYLKASLHSKLSKNYTKIDGKIEALKGVITYEAKKEHYVQDDDIIIIQKQKALKEAKKENNLMFDVILLSKKPIRYKVKDTNILLNFDLQFWKEKQQDLELLGITKVLEGTHIEAEKEFNVQSGEILFAGAIFNPFLNISVSHLSDPYKILININGLLDTQIINFSSTPFLTQSDILSILLFNSTTEDLMSSNGDTSKAAISMFGNTFAKELVENFGIKLDKLVLLTTQEGGFGLMVGKKISKKITLLYINDIVQTIKIKYQNSRRFETDFTFSPNRSGIDFLYKNEY